MGVQDRDWYWKDRERKERAQRTERDSRSTEYNPKQDRGSRSKRLSKAEQHHRPKTHWLVQATWWIGIAMALWFAYLFVTLPTAPKAKKAETQPPYRTTTYR